MVSSIALYQRENNEYGTDTMRSTCPDCKREFTVTPFPAKPKDWAKCLGVDCKSYDPARDCDDRFA